VTRFRAPAAVGVALVILVLTAGPAFARWKGLSDLNMDDGGHVCRSGVEFALAHFAPASESAEVRNVTADPDVVVVPSTPLARLVFSPVPERSATDPYYYSSIYRILFPKKVPAGTQLEIHFSGTSSAISATLAVADCRLGKPVSEFLGLANPPDVNAVTTTDPIALTFKVPGQTGLDIFSEVPTYWPIPCSPTDANPGYVPPAPSANGTVSFDKSSKSYTYLWTPPTGLIGCQEVWFRLKGDGLQHRALFDFGP